MSGKRRNVVQKAALFQRSPSFDDLHFAPVQNLTPLNVNFSDIVNPNEFSCCSFDVFMPDSIVMECKNALPTLSLAAKTATALMMSLKFLSKCVGFVLSEIHSNNDVRIDLFSEEDIERARKLIKGGFIVGMLDPTRVCFGDFDRNTSDSEPRTIGLNGLLLKRISETAVSSVLSPAARKVLLRKYAWITAVTLVHEAGGHALHGMIRPDYFFDSAMQLKRKSDGKVVVCPPRQVANLYYDDLGTMLEAQYFGGAIPGIHLKANTAGESLPFAIDYLTLTFQLQVGLGIDVRTEDFMAESYEDDGIGMGSVEIADALVVANNYFDALKANTDAVSNPDTAQPAHKRPVLPSADEYEGNPLMKLRLLHITPVERCLDAQFAAVAAPTSTSLLLSGSSTPIVVQTNNAILHVGGKRGEDGHCHC